MVGQGHWVYGYLSWGSKSSWEASFHISDFAAVWAASRAILVQDRGLEEGKTGR